MRDERRSRLHLWLGTLLYLAIGGVVTVLVSWALMVWGEYAFGGIEHDPDPSVVRDIGLGVPDDWDIHTIVVSKGTGTLGVLVTEMHWMGSTPGMSTESGNRSVQVIDAGWPKRAMRMRGPVDTRDPGLEPWATIRKGLPVDTGRSGSGLWELPRGLPLSVLPLGFFVNSCLYGCAAAFVVMIWKAVRFVRRFRRGRCVWCGYELGGVQPCPECGRTQTAERDDGEGTETRTA